MITAVQSTLTFFALTFCWKAYTHREKRKVRILSSGHQSRVTQAAIRMYKFEHFNHPPYSLDLALSDYCLFRNLTSHLLGARFLDGNELRLASDFQFLPMGIGFPTKSKSKIVRVDRMAVIIQLTKIYSAQK